jgi:hypothetical protein
MGARSVPRSYGAGMEPAHARSHGHSVWKWIIWGSGAWVSDPEVQEYDREKISTDQLGVALVNRRAASRVFFGMCFTICFQRFECNS